METFTSIDKTSDQWAEFSVLPAPNIQLHRYDNNGVRFYWWVEADENGEIFVCTGIGITSLLGMVMPTSSFLIDWKVDNRDSDQILKDSSDYGTLLHIMFSNWMTNRFVPPELIAAAKDVCLRAGKPPEMPEKDLLAFIQFCEDYSVKPLLIEAMLVSPTIGSRHEQFCQTIDLLCEISETTTTTKKVENGVYKSGPRKGQAKTKNVKEKVVTTKTVLIDFKSNFQGKDSKSFFDSHLHQLIGGKRAVEYNYPDIKIEGIANWSPNQWRTQPSYTFRFWSVKHDDEKVFDTYIRQAYLKGLFRPKGKIFVAPEFNADTRPSSFEMVDYETYIKKYKLGI